jgi:fibronectin type 3 domain-containing protein
MRRELQIAFLLLVAGGSGLVPAAQAQTCAVNVPHVTGQWMVLPYQMPINPISATLLRNGKVLIVSGSENDASNHSEGSESYRNAVWDPTGTTQASIAVQNIDYDVFCSGTGVLPDGRALVVGGTSDYVGAFKGDNRASIFDPATGKFVQSQSMANGRWYATATALGDGRLMAFSGLDKTGSINRTVEIYDPANPGAGWSAPKTAPFGPQGYPRLFVLPDGRVFFTGQGNANAWIFDPVPQTWTVSAATTGDRVYGSSVLLPLLPPAYTPRVMNLGGGSPGTQTTEIIDLSAASPAFTPGPNMSTRRIQMNAVILPNGKVLASGGSVNNEAPDTPGKTADLYDPVSNTFSSAGTASYSRLYHSTLLLLPDARVASMGSNPPNRGRYEPTIEIYTPSYLFDANDRLITTNRPTVTIPLASQVVGYNHPFSVTTTSVSPISAAVLVRPGSSTHASDMEQRLIGLCGPSPQPPCTAGGTLDLTSPPDGNVAPPGYYMLFVLDSAGVPSKAGFIQLTSHAGPPPDGAITSPAGDVTIAAGGSVTFGTTTSAARYSWVFPGGSPATSTAQNPGAVQFSVPGTYTASLAVVDSSGNWDPSPPTRTVTVTPATPDFAIAVTPSAQTVAPGGSKTFTVAVTAQSGFSGSVALSVGSESGLPTGVTSGGFSPASITGSGTSTLTMNTTTSAIPYALSLTITGTSGTLSHTGSTTLLVNLAAPTSLTATAGNGQVALSWPASAAANGYHVKRATVSGGPYVTIACPTTTTYTNTGLTNGTTYYYVVSAFFTGGPDAGGESVSSSQVSAMPTASSSPPPSPTGLTATAGNGQVSLVWNASSGATSYRVKQATVSGGPYTVIASPTTTSFTNTGLTNGTIYYYVVSAVNTSGESGNSSQVSATPTASSSPPAPPSGLGATAGNAQVTLAWAASSGATSYRVKRATVSGGPYTVVASPTTTSFTNTGLTNGTTYYFVVSAVNSFGESANSSQVSATPTASSSLPPAPTGLVATAGNGQASLVWNAASGATSYRVKRATVSGGPYTVIASPTTTSYTNTGLTNGTTYYFVVSAVNTAGESANSAQVSAVPKPPPSAPTGLTATAGNAQVSLAWSASSGATSYRVKRATVSGGPYTVVASPTTTSYTNTGLTNGTTYYYVVSAVNSSGESANSAQVSAQPKALPTPPTGLTAGSPSKHSIVLTWVQSTSSGLTQNRIYRRTSPGSYTTTPLATISPTTTYTNSGLPRHTTFCYVVTAVTSAGESARSAEACATTR